MRLLFDHHLSRKLVARLADRFPDVTHVAHHELESAQDFEIWTFARNNSYTIVTKDSDFNDLSALLGAPPKIIWLRIGNSSTDRVEKVLRDRAEEVESFIGNTTDSILMIV